jgi:hypothetical protein
MKFMETHFDEYVSSVERINLHPNLKKYYNNFPENIENMGNLIFYGPSGVGKYSQMLYSISKYSPSELKYEKKISITFNSNNKELSYYLKISDIHYEVDMSLLGCNAKILWHEIYQQIIDIISTTQIQNQNKYGIIVCKDFHNIHSELLEIFYSYMQDNHLSIIPIKIIFIILTQEISFIPENILNYCEIINVSRPTKIAYKRCFGKNILDNIEIENINNIKSLILNQRALECSYKFICNRIIERLIDINEIDYIKIREEIYNIFIYDLNIHDCVWYILKKLIKRNYIKYRNLSKILLKMYKIFKYYNNNYRPIYHLESFLFYLIKEIHGI